MKSTKDKSQNTERLSVLVVFNDANNKQYTHSAVGCSAADHVIPRNVLRMRDFQTRGHTDDVQTVDGQTVADAAIVYV